MNSMKATTKAVECGAIKKRRPPKHGTAGDLVASAVAGLPLPLRETVADELAIELAALPSNPHRTIDALLTADGGVECVVDERDYIRKASGDPVEIRRITRRVSADGTFVTRRREVKFRTTDAVVAAAMRGDHGPMIAAAAEQERVLTLLKLTSERRDATLVRLAPFSPAAVALLRGFAAEPDPTQHEDWH